MTDRKILINNNTGDISFCGVKLKLTLLEAAMLRYMCINRNRWLKREDIIAKIWPDSFRVTRVVDVAVCKVNSKGYEIINNKDTNKKIIISSPGVGYRLNDDYPINIIGIVKENISSQDSTQAGIYHRIDNKKIEVELVDIANYNQTNFAVFKASGRYHIEPNSVFFTTYRKSK